MSLDMKTILASPNLPSLPGVAMKVLQLARAPEPDIRQLVAVIKSDPALAAKILRTANSSLFGARQQVASIEQAVPLLGTMTVSSLVLSFSLVARAIQPGAMADVYQQAWRNFLIQAVAADSLARRSRCGVPAEFFVLGLLQDVGVLALIRTVPDQYVPVWGEQDQEPHRPLVELERQQFGFTHVDISVELCRRWKLADSAVRAIAAHHDSPAELAEKVASAPAASPAALATAAAIADFFCRPAKQTARTLLEELAARHFQLSGDALHDLLADIHNRVRETAELFACDLGSCPSYEEILAEANAELANLALRAGLAGMHAEAQARSAQQEIIELQNQQERLRTQAYRDSLTGLYNRLFFEEVLEREHARCVRYGGSLGVIFLDIDHFKQFNDNYGHPFGDETLKRVAQAIQSSVRETDVVARLGGEEFVVLALHIGEPDLLRTAERIRANIESMDLRLGDRLVRVTASLGAALSGSQQHLSPGGTRLVQIADQAMYAAKRNGRNQVHFAPCAVEGSRGARP
jgi:diguanylate cyclase (GGDEF)-like protein